MSNVLRVVPVVDGLAETSSNSRSACTTVHVHKENVLVGKSIGSVDCYRISSLNQPISIPTLGLAKTVESGSNKPVTSIVAYDDTCFFLSNENVYWFSISSGHTPNLLYKGASAITVHERSHSTSALSLAVASTKKRLVIFVSRGSGFETSPDEIQLGSELITKMVWFNSWIVGATGQSYVTISPSGDKVLRDIMPIDSISSISLLKASNEVLLVGQDGLGIFMAIQSDGLFPAPRNTVSIHHRDISVSVLGTYLAITAAQEGVVDVYPLTTNDPKLIQTINLPSSVIASSDSFTTPNGSAFIAGSVMYLLITVPFETQFKKLIEASKYEDALELINYQYPQGEGRDGMIEEFHRQTGWKLFREGEFKIAFVHFNLCMTAKEVLQVVEKWDKANVDNEAFTGFLLGQRSIIARSDNELLAAIDSVLLELLPEPELVKFIKEHDIIVEDKELMARLKSPLVISLLCEKSGDLVRAVDVLSDNLPESQSELISLISRHHHDLDKKMVLSVLSELVKGSCSVDSIVRLILRLDNPLELLKSMKDCPKSIVKSCLMELSDTNRDALDQLIELSINDVDVETVEKLVCVHSLKDEDDWMDAMKRLGNFDFARMLMLGNAGKYREAFIQFPERGEDFVASIMSRDSKNTQLHVNLIILFLSVLFEHGETDKAVRVLLKHSQLLSHPPCRPSLVIDILPNELELTKPLVEFLKTLNKHLQNRYRDAVINENLSSFKFLNTYSEWSSFRQSKPALITEETSCSICQLPVCDKQLAIGVLPNGNPVHALCIDSTNLAIGKV